MKNRLINLICITLSIICAMIFTSCDSGGKDSLTPQGNSTETYNKVSFDGIIGNLFSINETEWLQHGDEINSAMYDFMENRENNPIEKTQLPWFGEGIGKLLTAIAYTYSVSRNEETLKAGNRIVNNIKRFQAEDGYVGTYSEFNRFSMGELETWDEWNHFHVIYGLCEWYSVTGNEIALEVAKKAADCVIEEHKRTGYLYKAISSADKNFAVSYGFARLYNITKEQKYLDEAEKIVSLWTDLRSGDWLNNALQGYEFYQSRYPRWEVLYSVLTLAEIYKIDPVKYADYFTAFEQIYYSILKTDVHNNGGFSCWEAAKGDPFEDNGTETCSTVAFAELSLEYFNLTGNSIVADELERLLLNSGLAAQLTKEGGSWYTYNTPSTGHLEESYITLSWQGVEGAEKFTCCQGNGPKLPGLLGKWAFIHGEENELYYNYYGKSVIETNVDDTAVKFEQETEYPRSGDIKITVNSQKAFRAKLNLRIPAWANTPTVKINGELYNADSGTYFTLNRYFNNGDVIYISLNNDVHFYLGENNREGSVSMFYGPILMSWGNNSSGIISGSRTFTVKDLKDAEIFEDEETLISCFVYDNKGREILLTDFASCGKDGGGYTSWLKVENNDLKKIEFEIGGELVWNNYR